MKTTKKGIHLYVYSYVTIFVWKFRHREECLKNVKGRPPQSVASFRLSARHILIKAILQAHLSKTTQILMIYKGRHIFSPPNNPGTLSDCGGLQVLHMTFAWTKWDLYEKIIGHIMARAKTTCITQTNLSIWFLTSDIDTLSNKYWTHCPRNIEYCAT